MLNSDVLAKRYKVSCCSCVFLVYLIFAILAIAIPYVIAYYTMGKDAIYFFCLFSLLGFWVKSQTYYEEPDVDFNGEISINLLDNTGQSSLYSTNVAINNLQT